MIVYVEESGWATRELTLDEASLSTEMRQQLEHLFAPLSPVTSGWQPAFFPEVAALDESRGAVALVSESDPESSWRTFEFRGQEQNPLLTFLRAQADELTARTDGKLPRDPQVAELRKRIGIEA